MDWRVAKVVGLVEPSDSRDGERRSVTVLGKAVNLSSSRVRHIFKAATGVSLGKFAKLLKMSQAARLLESSSMSVKEIWAKVGLGDRSHFTREFKKAFGATPSSYRSQFLAQTFRQDVEIGLARTATQ